MRQPAEVVHDAQYRQREAEQEARRLAHRLCDILGVVVTLDGLYLVYLLAYLAVNVEYRVRRFKDDLDRSLGRVDGETALDGHNDLNVVARVDAAADDEAVHSRQHGYAAYVSRDYEMQDADALIAVNPQLAQAAVNILLR